MPPTQVGDSVTGTTEQDNVRADVYFDFMIQPGFPTMNAETLISILESFDFESYDIKSYGDLEYALALTICHPKGGFPIGQSDGHQYALHITGLHDKSLNFTSDCSQTRRGILHYLNLEKSGTVILKI
ncbi:hypothetical protein G7Y89_g7962 [Cudoniella acicularis]|uniref:Uncharacterized protein n=1 Tax=Cudoniella acicularis TaxID=354080 RepID=A0A8H4RJ23_9HELO|nr:hypothetical protein G7Y89_g7962 [Cudoniella acicularis]